MSMPLLGTIYALDDDGDDALIEAEIDRQLQLISLDDELNEENFRETENIELACDEDLDDVDTDDDENFPEDMLPYTKRVREQTQHYEHCLAECDELMRHQQASESCALSAGSHLEELALEYGKEPEYFKKVLEKLTREEDIAYSEIIGENGAFVTKNTKIPSTSKTEECLQLLSAEDGVIQDGIDNVAHLEKLLWKQLEEVEQRYHQMEEEQIQKMTEQKEREMKLSFVTEQRRREVLEEIEKEKKQLAIENLIRKEKLEKEERESQKILEEFSRSHQLKMDCLSKKVQMERERLEEVLRVNEGKKKLRRISASVLIQSVYRGFRVRKLYRDVLKEKQQLWRKRWEEERIKQIEEERKQTEERVRQKQKEEERRKIEEKRKMMEENRKMEEAKRMKGTQKMEEKLLEEKRKIDKAKIIEEKRKMEEAKEGTQKMDEKMLEEKIKMEETKRKVKVVQMVEENRKIEEAKRMEGTQKMEETLLEEKRKMEEAKMVEKNKKIDEAKMVEEKTKMEEAKEGTQNKEGKKRMIEEKREMEEAKMVEEKRKMEEVKMVEEKRKMEEVKMVEEKRKMEEVKMVEEKRKMEEVKMVEENRKMEEVKMVEENRKMEEVKMVEEKRKMEEAKMVEEKRKIDKTKRVEEKRKMEEAKMVEEKREIDKAKRVEENRKMEEAKEGTQNKEGKKRMIEEAKMIEENRKMDEVKMVEEKREMEEAKRVEEKRKMEEVKMEEEKTKMEEAKEETRKKEGKMEGEKRMIEEAKMIEEKRKIEVTKRIQKMEEKKRKMEEVEMVEEKGIEEEEKCLRDQANSRIELRENKEENEEKREVNSKEQRHEECRKEETETKSELMAEKLKKDPRYFSWNEKKISQKDANQQDLTLNYTLVNNCLALHENYWQKGRGEDQDEVKVDSSFMEPAGPLSMSYVLENDTETTKLKNQGPGGNKTAVTSQNVRWTESDDAKARERWKEKDDICCSFERKSNPLPESPIVSTTLPSHLEKRRLAWIQTCIPWGKVSIEPWTQKPSKMRQLRRALSSAKKQIMLKEELILAAAHVMTLEQVTTLQLTDLPGCSLTPLSNCTNLTYLSVTSSNLIAVENLQSCIGLKYLDVQNNRIEYMDLKGMKNVQYANLSHNNLTQIHGLDTMNDLRWLDLSYNRITKLSGLEDLWSIHTLKLSHNQLITTQGLSSISTLQQLDVSHNHLQRLDGVHKLCLLRKLDVSGNNLTEVPNLCNHVVLQQLFLDDNSLTSLDTLIDYWLPLLKTLSVGQNSLDTLSSFENFFLLKKLDVSNNQLSDTGNTVASIECCHLLEELNTEGNPFYEEQVLSSQLKSTLKCLHHLNNSVVSGDQNCPVEPRNSFEVLCITQTQQLDELEFRLLQELRSTPPTDLQAVCEIYYSYCGKMFKAATEHRRAHENGEVTSVVHPIDPSTPNAVKPRSGFMNSQTEEAENSAKLIFTDLILCSDNKPKDGAAEPMPASHENKDHDLNIGRVISLSTRGENNNKGRITKAVSRGHMITQEMIGNQLQAAWMMENEDCSQHVTQTEQTVLNKAATRIQSAWRGYRLRFKLQTALECARLINEDDIEFEEIDLNAFDMDELELEVDWKPADTPQLPESFPILGKPPIAKPSEVRDSSPVKLKQAWQAKKLAPQSVVSLADTIQTSPTLPISSRTSVVTRSGKKDESICEEWGFKNKQTTKLMLKRARKMKYNAERRKKLNRLDPRQRLVLFQKLDEVTNPKPIQPPARRVLPRKEYFQARQEEMEREERQRQDEVTTKATRTYEWVHTQLVNSTILSTRNNSSLKKEKTESSLSRFDKDAVTSQRQQMIIGAGSLELQSVESGSLRSRYSDALSLNNFHKDLLLPPIKMSSAPSAQKRQRISSWQRPDINRSTGWGGGKKRSTVKK